MKNTTVLIEVITATLLKAAQITTSAAIHETTAASNREAGAFTWNVTCTT
jgi:hypothetical protein